MSSFSRQEQSLPLLGVIQVDKLEKLISNPPRKGEVSRGWLGIYTQALTPDLADYWGLGIKSGIIVNEVAKESPADSAGLKTGDIIARVNGLDVKVNNDENIPIFQRQISDLGPGPRPTLRFIDGTKARSIL